MIGKGWSSGTGEVRRQKLEPMFQCFETILLAGSLLSVVPPGPPAAP